MRFIYALMWMLAADAYMNAPVEAEDRECALTGFYLRMIEVG